MGLYISVVKVQYIGLIDIISSAPFGIMMTNDGYNGICGGD